MMKRKLATILIMVLIITLMIPAAASAATSYKATLKLSGPDKDGNDQSISSSASYLDPATTLQVMATSFGDMVEAAEEAFSGTGLGDIFADFYDTFTSGTDAEWAALVDEVTITPAGAAAIIKDRDSTIDDLVDVSKTITAEYTVNGDTYTLKLTLSSQSSGGSGSGSSGGSSSSTHSVTVENTENGTAKLSKSKAEKGDTVTITVTPDEGYKVAAVTVTDADGKAIDVTKNSDGTYSFKMPNKKVKISVTFEKSEAEPEPEPEPEPTPEPVADRPFVDVKENDWFYEAVYYCYDQGWFKGVSDTEFAPKASMTRAMVVTVLWRLAGEPGVATTAPFSDVESGKWYSQAVVWAYNMGIIQGYDDGCFGVNDSVTREQLVVMLWRMLGKPAVTGDLSNFKDADQISSWAKEAMGWAVGIGVINGDDTGALNPGGLATRAEVAQIMMNNLKGN